MNTKKIHPLPIILAALWLVALGFATFFDLDISLAVADVSSIYGRALEIAGEPPAILFTSFNFALMMAHFLKKPVRTARDYILAALTLVAAVGTSVFTVNKSADYLIDYGTLKESMGVSLTVYALSAIIAAFVITLVMRMKRDTVERYFKTACRCAAVAVATFVIIWALKLVWGRVRFRQLDGDLTRFTAWYLPQGFTGFFSFPSGHTANATVILSVTYYLNYLPEKYRKFKPVIMALLGIWIVLVAFSRVRVGAHYLSDVLFGMAITLAIVYFGRPRRK
ncbi:MAG: phosphatase PAP2 family protein [Clostridia bacterium]|nr:phosphatase PAP2 family protein [Clostridia bacterium]